MEKTKGSMTGDLPNGYKAGFVYLRKNPKYLRKNPEYDETCENTKDAPEGTFQFHRCERGDKDKGLGDRLFDHASSNVHLFPELFQKNKDKDYIPVWSDFFDARNAVRGKLVKMLCDKGFDVEGAGKNGNLVGIPPEYGKNKINQFFRYIRVKQNDRNYTINFQRFYIDKENKVNTIYGLFQFVASPDKKWNEKDNSNDSHPLNEQEKIILNYPHSYKGQNKKMIRFSPEGRCIYNPSGVGDIWTLKAEIDNPKKKGSQMTALVSQFLNFIDECEKEYKKTKH